MIILMSLCKQRINSAPTATGIMVHPGRVELIIVSDLLRIAAYSPSTGPEEEEVQDNGAGPTVIHGLPKGRGRMEI